MEMIYEIQNYLYGTVVLFTNVMLILDSNDFLYTPVLKILRMVS